VKLKSLKERNLAFLATANPKRILQKPQNSSYENFERAKSCLFSGHKFHETINSKFSKEFFKSKILCDTLQGTRPRKLEERQKVFGVSQHD